MLGERGKIGAAAAATPEASAHAGYSCGLCGHVHHLHARDTIRCVQCGYRIMYKMRGKAPIHSVAR